MPEQIRCPSCDAALRVPDSLLGKNVKCPKCQTTFTASTEAPAEAEVIAEEPIPSTRRPARLPEDDAEEDFFPEEDDDRPHRRRRRGGRSTDEAESAVFGPAIALIVSAALGMASDIIYLVLQLIGLSTRQVSPVRVNQPGYQLGYALGVIMTLGGPLIGILMCIVVLLGAVKMKNLQSYGLAMTACILAMLPCNFCCFLGIPFGIWGLVMLSKPEVKDAFSRNR